MRSQQVLRRASVLAGTAFLAFSLSAGVAQAESYTTHELVNCVGDPNGCNIAANDAGPWALGVAQARYPAETLHNGSGDAFRHCIWAGAVTQRIGGDRAWNILAAHEAGTPLGSERAMDYGNNLIGIAVGEQSVIHGGSDTWGYIIDTCAQLGQADRLYMLGYDPMTRA